MPKLTGKASQNYGTIHLHKDKIIKLHSDGLTTYQIAKVIKFDPSSIKKYCDKIGLEFTTRNVEDYKDEIISMRNQGMSIRKIGKQFDFTHPTVSSLLKRYGVDTEQNTINLNHNFFDIIDSEEKAWCLGLMMSDGCVQHGKVILTMTDLDVIEKFKKCLEYEGNIREILPELSHHKMKYQVNINSVKMTKELKKYGVIPNKSLVLKFPDLSLIPNNLLCHLVRGVHDGDGCLTLDTINNKWKIAFTGTLEVNRSIETVSGIKLYYDHIGENNNNTWHAVTRKRVDIIKMLEWMYKDATIYMNRKKLLADQCLEDLRGRI